MYVHVTIVLIVITFCICILTALAQSLIHSVTHSFSLLLNYLLTYFEQVYIDEGVLEIKHLTTKSLEIRLQVTKLHFSSRMLSDNPIKMIGSHAFTCPKGDLLM